MCPSTAPLVQSSPPCNRCQFDLCPRCFQNPFREPQDDEEEAKSTELPAAQPLLDPTSLTPQLAQTACCDGGDCGSVDASLLKVNFEAPDLVVSPSQTAGDKCKVQIGLYDQTPVAVRWFALPAKPDGSYFQELRKLADDTARMHHPHLQKVVCVELCCFMCFSHTLPLQIAGAVRHENGLLVVQELARNRSLADVFKNPSQAARLSIAVRHRVALEVAQALTYLHAHNLVHGRLKPSNILLDESFRVKVSAFRNGRRC